MGARASGNIFYASTFKCRTSVTRAWGRSNSERKVAGVFQCSGAKEPFEATVFVFGCRWQLRQRESSQVRTFSCECRLLAAIVFLCTLPEIAFGFRSQRIIRAPRPLLRVQCGVKLLGKLT